MNLLTRLFKSSTQENIPSMKKYLIVGLGNVGSQYRNTKHNIGFKVLDHLARKEDLRFDAVRLGDRADFKFKGRLFILLKPSTMINLSGKAVRYWMQKENIPLENLLVVVDDINLDFGTVRLKKKGSDGGHNGLKDIHQKINTSKYCRFRFGIGAEFSKGRQIDYVLSSWGPEEENQLEERLDKSAELIKTFGTAGANIAMNTFNGK